eukprot:scaffold648686_cov36-Prasinocladus_malaysianus.AAC.1
MRTRISGGMVFRLIWSSSMIIPNGTVAVTAWIEWTTCTSGMAFSETQRVKCAQVSVLLLVLKRSVRGYWPPIRSRPGG